MIGFGFWIKKYPTGSKLWLVNKCRHLQCLVICMTDLYTHMTRLCSCLKETECLVSCRIDIVWNLWIFSMSIYLGSFIKKCVELEARRLVTECRKKRTLCNNRLFKIWNRYLLKGCKIFMCTVRISWRYAIKRLSYFYFVTIHTHLANNASTTICTYPYSRYCWPKQYIE